MDALSGCCREFFRAVLSDKGEWMLRCQKCDKVCASLEKYTIDPVLFKF